MKEKSGLVVWSNVINKRCTYNKSGTATIVAAAGVSLLNFLCAWKHAYRPWMYIPAIVACICAILLASVQGRQTQGTSKLPSLLYACYYIILSCSTFAQMGIITANLIPLLFLNALKLAGGTILVVLLFPHIFGDKDKNPLYWDLVKDSAFAGAYADMTQFITVVFSPNKDLLLNENLLTILMRMLGEFWFAFIVVIALQPKTVTLSFRKLKKFIRDYKRADFCVILFLGILRFILTKRIGIWYIMSTASMLSIMIASILAIHRTEVVRDKWWRNPSRNFVKEFCLRKWAYSYHEVQDIANIQKQLCFIEREIAWIETFPLTEFHIQRLNQLYADEYVLEEKLFWKYSIQSAYYVGDL